MLSEGRHCSRTVLVVEDNADDAELLKVAASAAEDILSFHVVRDGEQALAYLKGEGPYADRHAHPFPDLVLLDLWLPGMNGFDVLAWIRAHPQFSALKVFMWTDASDPAVLDRALETGASRFVPKSVAFVRGGLAGLVRDMSQAILEPAKDAGLAKLSA